MLQNDNIHDDPICLKCGNYIAMTRMSMVRKNYLYIFTWFLVHLLGRVFQTWCILEAHFSSHFSAASRNNQLRKNGLGKVMYSRNMKSITDNNTSNSNNNNNNDHKKLLKVELTIPSSWCQIFNILHSSVCSVEDQFSHLEHHFLSDAKILKD